MDLGDFVSEAAVIAIIVTECASCPFVMAPDDPSNPDEPWRCDAHGFDIDGDPRTLPEQRWHATWPPPPEWCPLREADRLVTLRKKGER